MTSHDLITSFIGTGLPEPINSCAFSTLYDPLFCEGVMMCMERKEGSRTKEGGGREGEREGGREEINLLCTCKNKLVLLQLLFSSS